MIISCYKCGVQIDVQSRAVGRNESCTQCLSDLRVCLNCDFYDTSRRYDCREEISERVAEKDRGNFCDHFRPKIQSKPAQVVDPKIEALKRAEALFKKK